MEAAAKLLEAIGHLVWPAALIGLLLLFRRELRGLFNRGGEVGLEILGNKLTIKPTAAERKPDTGEVLLDPVPEGQPLPADYYFLNHTSFLRADKQAEFQNLTGLAGVPHYDIRVVLDSYYAGALDRVRYVVYLLHEAYPEPVQARSRRDTKFLLKEVANGEYVLLAKVFLKDREEPVLLQRYITLWKEGPRLG